MNRLRRSRSLGRLVAAWFLLWTATMPGAPLVAPAGLAFVCSAGSTKLVASDDAGGAHLSGHLGGQCPACVHTAAPPPLPPAAPMAALAPAQPPVAAVAPSAFRESLAPPPARGPPVRS